MSIYQRPTKRKTISEFYHQFSQFERLWTSYGQSRDCHSDVELFIEITRGSNYQNEEGTRGSTTEEEHGSEKDEGECGWEGDTERYYQE